MSTRSTTDLLTLEKLLPPHLPEAKAKDSDYLHLSLGRGEIFVIFGPQGSGKSELLACLAGLKQPKKGRVLYRGKPQSRPTARDGAMVPRIPGVYEELTVWEYLEFFADVYAVDDHYRRPMIACAIAICELSGKEGSKIGGLPFALRKRLSVARAILPDPHLLLLDDPFYRLDRNEQAILRGVLARVQERGTTLVATAPGLGEFSDVASHLCVLTSKRVLAYGPTSHLRASLSCFKMMQVQFESGFRRAVKVLDEVASVHHLSISMTTANLVRFLFKGTDQELTDLLREMAQEGATIVSYVEDQEFLGRGGRRLPR
jgi:ABC-2 type transport system ATP-binding protein